MNLSFQPAPQHSNIFWGFPRTRKVRSPPWDITLNGPPSTGQPQSSLISVILQDLERLIWSRSRSFVSSRGVFCLLCERNQPGESLSTGGGTPAELQQTGPAGWSEIQTKPSSNGYEAFTLHLFLLTHKDFLFNIITFWRDAPNIRLSKMPDIWPNMQLPVSLYKLSPETSSTRKCKYSLLCSC